MRKQLFVPSALILLFALSPIYAGTYSGGNGSEATPYLISDPNDWKELMTTSTDWASHFLLTTDIDLIGITLMPVAPDTDISMDWFQGTEFTGVFDGNGYVIRNVTINLPSNDFVGVFGYVGEGGQIKNFGVENTNITGRSRVGGLVGENDYGSLTSCYVSGTINGGWDVGGLIGGNAGIATLCYVSGTISGTGGEIGGLVGSNSYDGTITLCYSAGWVNGNKYGVGGLVGYNSGSITSCYATSSVNSTDDSIGGLVGNAYYGNITACYAIGDVSGDSNVGGLVGYNMYGIVNKCYATGTIIGNHYVGGLIGDNDFQGNVTSCYATGDVDGWSYVGGLLGYNYQGQAIRCYSTGKPTGNSKVGGFCGAKVTGGNYEDTGNFWDKDTSQTTTSAMGVYKTTAEMKILATFTTVPASWDFLGETDNGTNDDWRMCVDDFDYPRLTWQYVKNGDFECPNGVNLEDLARLSADWLDTYSSPLYGADANGDQTVNLLDFKIFADNWLIGP